MSAFVAWNDLLLSHFFNPAVAGEEVFLLVTTQDLDSFGMRLGGEEGLIEAVKEGPPWLLAYSDLAEATRRLVAQRTHPIKPARYVDPCELNRIYLGFDAPTYLPFLALWVLAASKATEGFYAGVAKLSGKNFEPTQQCREVIQRTWSDLERWTKKCDGNFGKFEARQLGAHSFVGLAKAQSLVVEKDAKGLPKLFYACRLRPSRKIAPHDFMDLRNVAHDAYYLSAGLRIAFNDIAYKDPLIQILERHLSEWDGKNPQETKDPERTQKNPTSVDRYISVCLELKPRVDGKNEWSIHWEAPRVFDTSRFNLTHTDSNESVSWELDVDEYGSSAFTLSADHQSKARFLLSNASENSIEFVAHQSQQYQDETVGEAYLIFPARKIRLLRWDPVFQEKLIEDKLPLFGPCYVLHQMKQSNSLGRNLASGKSGWQLFESEGLPADWRMGLVQRCELLSDRERESLTDYIEEDNIKARVTLRGGRRVSVGGGRIYAFYDLPYVDIESDASASVQYEGLSLNEVSISNELTSSRSATKRYQIRIEDNSISRFQINVVSGQKILATTILKVSTESTRRLGSEKVFGVGPFGDRSIEGAYVLGVLRGPNGQVLDALTDSTSLSREDQKFSLYEASQSLSTPSKNIASQFLDSLGDLGSIAYGSARDQLLRLARQVNIEIRPVIMLMELRSLGHLELETDESGHLIRVHSVPPVVYSLPLDHGEWRMFSVLGSLRLGHWADCQAWFGGFATFYTTGEHLLPGMIIVSRDETSIKDFVEISDFDYANRPALQVAEWSKGIKESDALLSQYGMESPSIDFGSLTKFIADGATFSNVASGNLSVEKSVGVSLFRFEDPRIQGLTAYLLGRALGTGIAKYSFLKDSRIGLWIVLGAFANFIRESFSRGDVYPWPLHYSRTNAELYIPAKLKPPFLIERALILCSGRIPDVMGSPPNNVSDVYGKFLEGIWLRYRNIPIGLARILASKLEAKLSLID